MSDAEILDVACGGRMFWFNKSHPNAIYGDIRKESHTLCDGRVLNIEPDIEMDFRAIPFPDESFSIVVFDPPHLFRAGDKSWLFLKYGKLGNDWRKDISKGFSECFRVLKPNGVLIFKWNETQICVSEILKLTNKKPVIGHKSGKTAKTHWITFMKESEVKSE